MNPDKADILRNYGLDSSVIRILEQARPILLPHLDEVLDQFYEKIGGDASMSAFFARPGLLEHARSKQKDHWKNLFSASFDESYFHGATTIGKVHFRIGLPLEDYIGQYARVGAHLRMIVLEKAGCSGFFRRTHTGVEMLDAVTRALVLDTLLVVGAYHRAQTDAFAKRMAQMSAQFESDVGRSVDVLGGSIRELDTATGGMSGDIDRARQGAGSLYDTASQIAASSQSVAAAIEQLSSSIASVSSDVNEAASASSTASDAAVASSMQIASLESAAEEIGEVANLISEIAKQTNLLAVNATVEASRAGEAGKGFAVVAYEVKALAERISEATGSITNRIERIQSETRQIAGRMGGIGESVGKMQCYSESIRVAIEEQKKAAKEIAQHAEATATNTNEMAEMIQDVSTRVERSGDASNSLRQAVSTVSNETISLSERVRSFLTSIKAA